MKVKRIIIMTKNGNTTLKNKKEIRRNQSKLTQSNIKKQNFKIIQRRIVYLLKKPYLKLCFSLMFLMKNSIIMKKLIIANQELSLKKFKEMNSISIITFLKLSNSQKIIIRYQRRENFDNSLQSKNVQLMMFITCKNENI